MWFVSSSEVMMIFIYLCMYVTTRCLYNGQMVGGDCMELGLDTDDGRRDLNQCYSLCDATRLVYFKPAARCGVLHPHFSELPVTCWATRLGDWHPRRTDMVLFRPPRVAGVPGG